MKRTKKCGKCLRRKKVDSFYRQSKAPDGLSPHCKACMDETRARNRAKKANEPKIVPMEKKCRDCGKVKPAHDFSVMASSGDGLYSYCKKCKAKRVRGYVDENREEVNRKARERGATPEGKRATRNGNLKAKFGVTHEHYEDRLREQGGGCGICGRRPVEGEKHFATDHDHGYPDRKPPRLRGVLCHDCNRALGLAKDNIDLLTSGAAYLVRAHRRIRRASQPRGL